MPNQISNTLKDSLGMVRAVIYRTFIERNWSRTQPMFNILQVKSGKEPLFEDFLKESLDISLKYDTPISLGPYKDEASRTYIYVTHYASTVAYLKVMVALLLKGKAAMRAKATEQTSWTYCNPSDAPQLENLEHIMMASIQGNAAPFLNFLNQKGETPVAIVKKIKDVRGHSLGTHIFLAPTDITNQIIADFREEGGDISIMKASKLT